MNPDSARGVIFDIQHYSIHDGPGIRTTIFLKGCPLRCPWCQNPESWHLEPEKFFTMDTGATPVVGNGAFEWIGRSVTAAEVFREAEEDGMFYAESGGGVTLSGGEPLAQPQFARSILAQCRGAGFHTVLDTTGYAEWEVLRGVLEFVDLVLFDFKHMDSTEHLRRTGVPNELILENARRIHRDLGIPIRARMPIISGWNDSAANIEATARFIAEQLDSSVPVHLLKFNRLGSGKYERLGRIFSFGDMEPQSDDRMDQLKQMMEAYGLKAMIGG
jgi:pyruvate formate lyase activating enzyme